MLQLVPGYSGRSRPLPSFSVVGRYVYFCIAKRNEPVVMYNRK